MNDFAIVRDKQADKIGLSFPTLGDFEGKSFEVIPVTWEEGYYINSSGTKTASATYKCAVVDISKYDQVILPYSTSGTTATVAGVRAAADSGSVSPRISATGSASAYVSGFAVFSTQSHTLNYACISMNIDMNAPVIGIL